MRGHGDDGSGLLSSVFGCTVFLVLLFVAVQSLTNLYTTSVVTAATFDACRRAATHGHAPTSIELADAELHARGLLGRLGAGATFDWSATDGDVVRLRVVVTNPRFVPLVPLVGLDTVDRTVSVRVEEPR